MNILYIVPYAPNVIRVRPYQLIRSLVRQGHQVTLATVWTSDGERTDLEQLATEGVHVVACRLPRWRPLWNCLRALPGSTPLQAVYCWQPSLAQALQFAIRHSPFAIAHVEHLRGARYGLHLKSAICNLQSAIPNPQSAIPVVWDSVDCISLLFEQALQMGPSLSSRLKAWLDLARTRRYEGWLVTQFDRVLVTSDIDRQSLKELANRQIGKSANRKSKIENRQSAIRNPQSAITVLPNGVALDYFTPTDEPRESATLVITGKMSYHANVAAALYLMREIMPRVWAQRPEVKLLIVGQDPPREIRQFAIRNPQSAIRVTGTVPDIRPYLRRATVAVVPVTYGAGIQNKVLEAMACGTPVVATPQAVSALKARPDDHLLVKDGPEAFARAVLGLLGNADLRARLGTAGRRYVEAHHDWRGVAQRLEETYQDVLERRKWTV
jgi:glycosyltransferase involved in cell wall biosynthesis